MVLSQRSAVETLLDEDQDLKPRDVLTHAELGNELPTGSRARIPLQSYMKAAFAIDEACDVRIQSFLLIGRTCRFFTSSTIHSSRSYKPGVSLRSWVLASSARFSAFPAYSQVYRQRGLFTVSRMYSRITAGIDYTFTLFLGAGVSWRPVFTINRLQGLMTPSPRCCWRGSRYRGTTRPCYADVAQHPRRISASFSNSLGLQVHQSHALPVLAFPRYCPEHNVRL